MNAADLQAEFRRLRDEDRESGQRRPVTRDAYNSWFKQACAEGNPPDALRPNAGTETERFFARAIPGLDGHTYWDGPLRGFYLDGGGVRNARWWWYEQIYGPQERGRLGSVCGERNCITPEHQRFVPWSEVKRRYSDEQMLGAIQTVALRLGHTPTAVAYQHALGRPSREIIAHRFGGWEQAVRAAGLKPSPVSVHKRGPEDCIAALRHLAQALGHTPSDSEFRSHTHILRAVGLPTSTATIRLYLGRPWSVALRKAGLA